jgi:hypothetical protein
MASAALVWLVDPFVLLLLVHLGPLSFDRQLSPLTSTGSMAMTGRPMRPAAVKAHTFFGNLSQGGPYADGSDNEDDEVSSYSGASPAFCSSHHCTPDLTRLLLRAVLGQAR